MSPERLGAPRGTALLPEDRGAASFRRLSTWRPYLIGLHRTWFHSARHQKPESYCTHCAPGFSAAAAPPSSSSHTSWLCRLFMKELSAQVEALG